MKNKAEYPRRVPALGGGTVLQIALLTNEDEFDYTCGGLEQEFRVFLTAPGDSLHGRAPFKVSVSENSQMLISSKLITTSDPLRRYAPHERQCYYSSERPLFFFKEYTEQNCMTECLAMYIKQKCDCVKFSMPSMNAQFNDLLEVFSFVTRLLFFIHFQEKAVQESVAVTNFIVTKNLH